MPILKTLNNGTVPVKIWTDEVDLQSIEQLENVARLPFVFHHVGAMPDVHAGKGATIGSVIATKGAVIPAAVGVDLGCGMLASRTNLVLKDLKHKKLESLMQAITEKIPVGFAQRTQQKVVEAACAEFEAPLKVILEREPDILEPLKTSDWRRQMGTLGGGNHFIELCYDESERLWILLHTGSRGIGNIMATHFINKAKRLLEERGEVLPDPNLAYLSEGTDDFESYMMVAAWAQRYAFVNRQVILEDVLEALRLFKPKTELTGETINCHHNYVASETHFGQSVWVTRKGAIRAGAGEKGIIPGSMGAPSYLVEGLGNEESFLSSAHGAGRRMSRAQAKSRFSVNDLKAQTEGIACRKDRGVLDEIPSAYKSIKKVMQNQSDLTRPLHELKQILCIKG